ncbi:MAG: putative O-glycosylation ligase, exosortase A system-associated [Chromatiaceae bacterium]|nr:putative O-glycosylation ligase, exosortase A system-associated [Chromatiaceae bacterium]
MRDLLLLAIVCGLLPVILWRPWIGVLAWFWIGLMAPHKLAWGFMTTFPVAMLIGGATLSGLLLARERRALPLTREMLLLTLFVAAVTLSSTFAVNPAGAWSYWVHLMKILLLTFITPLLIWGERRILWLLLVITGSVAFYGFKGGLFAILTGGQHMVMGPPNSFLEGNTFIGVAMIMVLPLILVSARAFHQRWARLGWPLIERHSRLIGWGLYGVFWLTALAILVTYSRGALLGLVAIAPLLFVRMRHKVLMASLAILVVGVIGISAPERLMERWSTIENFEEDRSAMQRIQAWGANLNMALERPLTGMGFNNGGMGYDWWVRYANFEGAWRHVLSPHSIYFAMLGQHGFVGLSIFLLLIGATFGTLGRIRRQLRSDPQRGWLAEYAWAIRVSLIGYLVAGAFLDVAYFELLYALIALSVILRRECEEGARDTLSEARPPERFQPLPRRRRALAQP